MLVAVGSALVASDALGPLSLHVDPSSPTYVVISLHPELASDHSTFFLVLSALLAIAAALNILPVQKPLSRLVFALVFAYCSAKALMGWAFPLSMSDGALQHGALDLPWVYCFASSLLGTSATLHSSLPSASTAGAWVFSLCGCLPVVAVVWAFAIDALTVSYEGIWWSACLVNACIGITTRCSELLREVDNLRRAVSVVSGGGAGAGPGPKPETAKPGRTNPVSASVCVIASCLTLFWAGLGTMVSHHLSGDYVMPLFGLVFLCTKRGMIFRECHPLVPVALFATTWWFLSTMYQIFVKGYGETPEDMFEPQFGLFRDEDISMWTSQSKWLPWLSFVLALVPLPPIVLGFLRNKDDTEEMLFVLAVLSVLSVVGAQATSVRLLGLVGLVYGSWRCYDIGMTSKISNRLI